LTYQVTDPEVLRRAKRIWVTELNSCPRAQEHRVLNSPRLGAHYTQLRGTLTHTIIDNVLSDTPIDIEKMNYSEIPEAKNKLIEELSEFESTIRRWKETTKLDLSQAKFEQPFELPLRDGFVLVGKMDCVTPTHIIDFKSGIKKNTAEYRMQLAAYNEYQKGIDKEHILTNIFFGDSEAVEFNPFDNPKTPYKDTLTSLQERIDTTVRYREAILNGWSLPCEIGMLCAFCRSRGICNGY